MTDGTTTTRNDAGDRVAGRRAMLGGAAAVAAAGLVTRVGAPIPAAAQDATPAAIERSNPDVGGMAEEVFTTFAFTQTIKAGNTLYFSGVTPLRGDLANLEVVGEGDLLAQVEWALEVIKRLLEVEGATFRNFVAQTVYTTDIAELVKIADVFPRVFGEQSPTSTWVEVKALFHPKQLVEISGIAVLD
jgi:2-iminobutanoate/2-iminopropanoate deaminase